MFPPGRYWSVKISGSERKIKNASSFLEFDVNEDSKHRLTYRTMQKRFIHMSVNRTRDFDISLILRHHDVGASKMIFLVSDANCVDDSYKKLKSIESYQYIHP